MVNDVVLIIVAVKQLLVLSLVLGEGGINKLLAPLPETAKRPLSATDASLEKCASLKQELVIKHPFLFFLERFEVV